MSVIPLKYLMHSAHELCAIAYEANSEVFSEDIKYPIIAGQNENVEMLAHVANVPVIKLFSNDEDYVDAIKSYEPDIIVVSCLAGKLTQSVLSIPRLGCYNLHPSLLPLFRGPVPLFWQFRQGIETFGITLHRMNAYLDTGPVIAQRRLSMPDGISNQQASELLAKAGTELLDIYLEKIAASESVEAAQNESASSTMSYPVDSDFVVSTSWSARHLYNFICATRHWDHSYPCTVDGVDYLLSDVISYQLTHHSEQVFSTNGEIVIIPCIDGNVTAKIVTDQPLSV